MTVVGGEGLIGGDAADQLGHGLDSDLYPAIAELGQRMEAAFDAAEARLETMKALATKAADALVGAVSKAQTDLRGALGASASSLTNLANAHAEAREALEGAQSARAEAFSALVNVGEAATDMSEEGKQAVDGKSTALSDTAAALVSQLVSARGLAVDLSAKAASLLADVAAGGDSGLREAAAAMNSLLGLAQQLLGDIDLLVARGAYAVFERTAQVSSASMSTFVEAAGAAGQTLGTINQLTDSLHLGVLGQTADVLKELEAIRDAVQAIRPVLEMAEKLT